MAEFRPMPLPFPVVKMRLSEDLLDMEEDCDSEQPEYPISTGI